jgi:bifunctional non-homologous end joining protein LigD
VAAALSAADDDAVVAIDGYDVAVTNLGRIYWPEDRSLRTEAVAKRDFLRYLVEVAPRMLPHIADRPLTLFRWPEGVDGRRVLMKHWETRLPPFVERVLVFSESKGRPDPYILCNNLATLVWLGHMGTLEFHAWHSRVAPGPDTNAGADYESSLAALRESVLERPDYLLFDIDPFIYTGREVRAKQPDYSERAFDTGREVAFHVKDVLDAMKLDAFVKTSGKTGLHVVVPIVRTLRYDDVRNVARLIASHVARLHRDRVTLDWSVDKRTGKVFIDYNMNVRGKSMTVPYSPRGLPGAPVSMPVTWQQLARVRPTEFCLSLVAGRGPRPDAWATIGRHRQDLRERLSAA